MELKTNQHSVFSLNYHLIMCVRYRNKVINDPISSRLREIFEQIAINYNIAVKEWAHDSDHVHCLLEAHPNSTLSNSLMFLKCFK